MARLNDWSDKLEALTIAGKYGEGGANTPVNRNTMPWLYEDDKQPTEPAGKDPKEVFEQLELPLDLVQLYRMQGDGITEFWDTNPADRVGPRGKSQYDDKIKEMNKWIAPLLHPSEQADAQGLTDLLSPFQNKKGSLKDSGLTKEEMIKLLKIGVGVHKA